MSEVLKIISIPYYDHDEPAFLMSLHPSDLLLVSISPAPSMIVDFSPSVFAFSLLVYDADVVLLFAFPHDYASYLHIAVIRCGSA